METYRKLSNIQKLFIPIYIVFLLFSFLYVRSILKQGNIEISEKESIQKEMEIKPAEVNLVIENPNNSSFSTLRYRVTLRNTDSILELIDTVRKEEKISYERQFYTYGTKFLHVNKIYSDDNFEWRVFHNNKDVTYTIDSEYLNDEDTYILRYTRIN